MSATASSPRFSPKSIFSFPSRILQRFKDTQLKKHNLKIKYRLIESSRSRSVPQINRSSKSLKKAPSFQLQNSRTKEILSNSRFMPKTIKTSIATLSTFDSPKVSQIPQKNNILISSNREDSPMFYPSLPKFTRRNLQNLPQDIQNRNRILMSLRKEASNRFLNEHEEPPDGSDIVSRTKRWLIKKKLKLEENKEKIENEVLKKCTFKPSLIKRRYFSEIRTLTTRSSENLEERYANRVTGKTKKMKKSVKINKPCSSLPTSPRWFTGENPYFLVKGYSGVSPIKMKIGYNQGISERFADGMKPMFGYTKIGYRNI